MPRVDDRPLPTIGGPRPAVEPWPAWLHIGVERQPPPAIVYDGGTAIYDDPEGDWTYDQKTPWPYERYDLFCRFHGLTIETGNPDDEGVFEAGHVAMTLDNRDGFLSQYDATGALVDWVPGAHCDIWATLDNTPGYWQPGTGWVPPVAGPAWWLFSGRITAWRERADGTIEAEAFDAFAEINQIIPDWMPGAQGQTVAERLSAICTQIGFVGPRRLDTGSVTLHSVLSDRTPLEEMQMSALSDGGVLVCDADGTLVYEDRTWTLGRADQVTVPMFTDNDCRLVDAAIMWDTVATTDDELLVNIVDLVNVADLVASARDGPSIELHGPHTLPSKRTEDLWIDQVDGDDLADHLIVRHRHHYLRLESFLLYVHDPRRDLWSSAIDLRIGDVIRWVHQQQTTTGPRVVVVDSSVVTILHEILPDAWVTSIAASRTTAYQPLLYYDRTPYRYDQAGATYVL